MSLAIKEIQSKTTMRYYCTPIGMTKTKKMMRTLNADERWRNWITHTFLVGM